eukprot:1976975-Alexandrium_andersonii.AAC.1
MSASLVGSEMCIRDSPELRAELRPEPRPKPHPKLHPELGPAIRLELRPCLLYTSDAADDM